MKPLFDVRDRVDAQDPAPPLNPDSVEQFLKKHDPPSYFGLRALDRLRGAQVRVHREDISRFLTHRYGAVPLPRYLKRVSRLRELQAKFERCGVYDASTYSDVPAIDSDEYRIALLLSFVLTNHRFDILKSLEDFYRLTSNDEPHEVLSLGFGTGYELKVAQAALPGWRYAAYDTSRDSLDYASDLLRFFGCSTDGLCNDLFPLEGDQLPEHHRDRYGKIVLCEILEHLERPEHALTTLRGALHPKGAMFATMAINIAQEDHVYLYRTKDDARAQVERAGFAIVHEFVAPVTVTPFAEQDRDRIFKKGNYVCHLIRK